MLKDYTLDQAVQFGSRSTNSYTFISLCIPLDLWGGFSSSDSAVLTRGQTKAEKEQRFRQQLSNARLHEG